MPPAIPEAVDMTTLSSVRLPRAVIKELRTYAAAQGMTMSRVILHALAADWTGFDSAREAVRAYEAKEHPELGGDSQ